MLARLQAALGRDAGVRSTVSRAHAQAEAGDGALLMWDGAWVQTPGEAGRGLAGVRQAIAVEIAFAPRECREQTMRGLALIVLDGGGQRLALGSASWRWSDLLEARRN